VLPALRETHPQNRPAARTQVRRNFFEEQQPVVNEHPANHANNQDQVNFPHPPVDLVADGRAALRGGVVHVDFAQGKLFIRARMALSTSLDQVVPVNRGVRIR